MTFVGRNPEASPGSTALAIADSTRTISRTHAAFMVLDGALFVEDRDSANGTLVERSGVVSECPRGGRLALDDGDVVLLGEVRLVVMRGGAEEGKR